MLEVLVLYVVVKVVVKTGVIDSVHIDLSVGMGKRFSKGVMLLGISNMGRV